MELPEVVGKTCRPYHAHEADLLAGAEALVVPLAQVKGIALLTRECDPALHRLGDEERVRQILLNLVEPP